MSSVDIPTSTNEAYELVKLAEKEGIRMRGNDSGAREREEEHKYEMIPVRSTVQPYEVPFSQPAPPLHSQVSAAGEDDYEHMQ